MSDTPRTDKLLDDQEFDRVPYDDACMQLKELCRELERELNKSKNIERQPPLDAAACSRGLFAIADGFIYRAGKTNDHTLCVWDVADILRTAANAMKKLELELDSHQKVL